VTSSSAGWRDAYGGVLFVVVFALAGALGYVGPLGLALLAALGGLAALPLFKPDRRIIAGAACLLGLALWGAVTMAWSRFTPDLPKGLFKMLGMLTSAKLFFEFILFTSLLAAAGRLAPAKAERALRIGAFAMTGLAAVLIVEGLAKAQGYMAWQRLLGETVRPDLAMRAVAQGGYVLALFVWPVGFLLRREGRYPMMLALSAGVVVAMVLFGADAPAVALVVGGLVMGCVLVFGRPAVQAVGRLSIYYVIAAPWLIGAASVLGVLDRLKAFLPASWDARLTIWSFAANRIAERPFLGWGLDASRTWPDYVPLHTHDAALQIWLELGMPGVLLVCGFLLILFRCIARAPEGRGYMGVAAAAATTYLIIGALSFGVWQHWWIGLGFLAACACMALKRAIPYWEEQDMAFGQAQPLQTP
jgi:O-antigen ligase